MIYSIIVVFFLLLTLKVRSVLHYEAVIVIVIMSVMLFDFFIGSATVIVSVV